jgi:ATP-binding cassette subfamily F protein uup
MLARLFTKPANLLVLDEPTNDLDIETLELLEDLLLDYEGTLLLVSHDRDFLDNVVTDCFVLDGTGRVIEYAGGYGDWKERERERKRSQVEKTAIGATKSPGAGKSAGTQKTRGAGISGRRSGGRRTERPRKISFKERRELEELPDSISSMEEERDRIHAELSDPELYRGGQPGGAGSADPSKLVARLEELEAELERAYERWEFLESLPR